MAYDEHDCHICGLACDCGMDEYDCDGCSDCYYGPIDDDDDDDWGV